MNPAWLILIGGAALLAITAALVADSRRRQRTERFLRLRLDGLRPAAEPEMAPDAVAQRAGVTAAMPRFVQVRLARLDAEPGWRQVLTPLALQALVVALVVHWFGLVAGLLAVVGPWALAAMAFETMARRRLDSFVTDLPGFLDIVKHLMLAGNSLQQALVRGIDTSGANIQRYLRPLARRVQNGAPASDSILWIAERLDLPELYIFGSAVETNTRFGGRMATTLGNLAQIVRDGARVRRELRSASAETRMSAWVLGLLPVVCIFGIMATNPGYMRFFVDTTTGQHMAMFCVAMQVMGVLAMRRILRVDF